MFKENLQSSKLSPSKNVNRAIDVGNVPNIPIPPPPKFSMACSESRLDMEKFIHSLRKHGVKENTINEAMEEAA